jgi:hypothetical protein
VICIVIITLLLRLHGNSLGIKEVNELLLVSRVGEAYRLVLPSDFPRLVISPKDALCCLIVDSEEHGCVLDANTLEHHVLYQLVALLIWDYLVAAEERPVLLLVGRVLALLPLFGFLH